MALPDSLDETQPAGILEICILFPPFSLPPPPSNLPLLFIPSLISSLLLALNSFLAELYDTIPGSLSDQKQKQTLDLAAGELASGAKVGVS